MPQKYYKYTLFYHKDDLELYAYTDDKVLADGFEEYRRKDIFIKKKRELTAEQLHELHEEYPGGLLRETKYSIGNREISIVTTIMEHVTVMNWSVDIVETRLPRLVLLLPPKLFTKDIQSSLSVIGYTDLWEYLDNKTSSSLPIKANYLACFFYLYGKTIQWNGGK